jgi:hypothetical protein
MVGKTMRASFRPMAAALCFLFVCSEASVAYAGDDGNAPLWVGIGSIFSPLLGATDVGGFFGLGGEKEQPPQIEYREHGKIVVPKSYDLPPPGAGAMAAEGGAWPVDQELQRKKLKKEAAKKVIAGQGDARLRYTHPFSNSPVTIRAADDVNSKGTCEGAKCDAPAPSSSLLGSLNPLGWVGMGKNAPLGPEPDREWLTDPPKGYRAPAGQAAN